jgi:hypothetical protein
MFRPSKRSRKRQASQRKKTRRLFLESLENRRVLAGVVDVDTTTDGDLSLVGDVSNNHIEVHGTAVPGQFVITGKSGTLLRLDSGLQTFPSLTINGITDDIFADLDHGQDTFELGTDTDETVVGRDVSITNEDDDTNIVKNVDIGGSLSTSRTDIAYSELQIIDTIIRGDVDAANGDGDTKTMITNSEIEGTLTISNGDGDDVNIVEGTSIGAAYFVRPGDSTPPTIPVVSISNGDGGSLTSFTTQNDPDSTGALPPGTLNRPTVFGGIDISNGDTIPTGLEVPPPVAGGATPDMLLTAVDIAVFNSVEVLGHLDIDNFDGHTETVIVDSKIGTDTKPMDMSMPSDGGYGEAVKIDDGDGYDVFLMDNSAAPYGLRIDTTGAAGTTMQSWGSQTDIRDSEIGTRESPMLGAGAALLFFGDDGDDVFNIADTTSAGTEIGGLMDLMLYDGDDSVQIVGLPGTVQIDSLVISGSSGDDSVLIQDTTVDSMVMIELHDGVDTLEIRTGVMFPSSLVGTVLLDGGIGADFYHIDDPLLPFMDFEILIP